MLPSLPSLGFSVLNVEGQLILLCGDEATGSPKNDT